MTCALLFLRVHGRAVDYGVVAITALDSVILSGTEKSWIRNWRYISIPAGIPAGHTSDSEYEPVNVTRSIWTSNGFA